MARRTRANDDMAMRLESDPYRELGELVMQVRRRWLREQAERQERAS